MVSRLPFSQGRCDQNEPLLNDGVRHLYVKKNLHRHELRLAKIQYKMGTGLRQLLGLWDLCTCTKRDLVKI